jgi:hypothetical protein
MLADVPRSTCPMLILSIHSAMSINAIYPCTILLVFTPQKCKSQELSLKASTTLILPRVGVTLDGVLDWILDLLAAYTHDSELREITAPPLISTTHKSPQHTLTFSGLLCLHQPFPGNGFDSGHSSAFALKSSSKWRLPSNCEVLLLLTASRTEPTWLPQLPSFYNSSARTAQTTPFSYANRFRWNVFTQPFPSKGRILLLIKNLLPSKGRRSVVCFTAVA